jgi:5-phospho-D-xylono-1,4-lactonase
MARVRTVLGDVDAAELGVTYAHEHLVIAGGRPVEVYPDIRLESVEKAVEELALAQRLGLASVVDAMPADCGRDVEMLAAISRRSGVNIIASTGLHTTRYYSDRHWSRRMGAPEVARLFIDEVEQGIDSFDLAGPTIRRTGHRAGVIKIGGSATFPDERDRTVFEAAAIAQSVSGAPVLTHCEDGLRGPEQVRFLEEHGADPRHVILSHVDKVVDRGYHRELADTGAFVEFDQGSRWGEAQNGTLRILEWLAEDGRISHVVMGHDHARRGYWKAYGGGPGMDYLLGGFSRLMDDRGLDAEVRAQVFVASPAVALSLAGPTGPASGHPEREVTLEGAA